MPAPTPIAVLLSGRGSNFLALHGAIERGGLPARIALVVSNVEGAPGIGAARELGLAHRTFPHAGETDRGRHEARIRAALADSGAEWVCLAGYMRRLSAEFVAAWRERILNIHPSLLPAFPGLHPQRQALAAGVRISGCTVHLVDEGLDSGPIVHQRAVPVLDADDEAALAARILVEEHRAYPEALARLLRWGWRIDGRRLIFAAPGVDTQKRVP
jgi:phosphoribosylglycinamide formyltransferase-1